MTPEARFGRIAPNRTFVSILFGALAGLSYALLIPIVLNAVTPDSAGLAEVPRGPFLFGGIEIDQPSLAIVFAMTCVFVLLMRTVSHLLLSDAASDISSSLRKQLYERVLDASVIAMETIGARRLDAAIATDIPRMVLGARMLPELLVSSVTLIGMLGFLLIRNSGVFWFVIASVTLGALAYQIPMAISQRFFIKSRSAQDDLHHSFAAVVNGFKELKLDTDSRTRFVSQTVLLNDREMTKSEKFGNAITAVATNFGDLINFFVIGFVIFIFVNYNSISREDLTGVVMVLLYITSPVAVILRALPQVAISRVAARRFAELLARLPAEPVSAIQRAVAPWTAIRLADICFRYDGEGGHNTIGPIKLVIPKGQVTFIVGGNGSGKSTLGKILALHYPPASGQVYFGAVEIGPECLVSYRNIIAAIHSDYHVFPQPLGKLGAARLETISRLIDQLGLAERVKIVAEQFSTIALSDGQRRRLALVQALADDRDVYLFDEWAADQDPEFKSYFYDQIIPHLRSLGKTVIAITHDDRYFHVADAVVFMEDGLIREIVHQMQSDLSEKQPLQRFERAEAAAIGAIS